jgi:hypothetical protein
VISESANLGFPSLPNIGGLSSSSLSAANWISGTHTVDIWYGGPGHLRIAVPVSFGETDLRVNGNDAWLWDSRTQTATHYVLPARSAQLKFRPLPLARPRQLRAFTFGPGAVGKQNAVRRCLAPIRKLRSAAGKIQSPVPASVRDKVLKCVRAQLPLRVAQLPPVRAIGIAPLTPQQIANRLLAAVGPTTSVTVPGTVTVAGRSAYQLVVAPRTNQSLIARIVIDVDSSTHLPLQVQVFARGSGSAAFQVGFTSLSFAQPAASNFTFTPPKGAHVKTGKLSSASLPGLVPGLGPLGVPRLGFGRATGIRAELNHRIKLHNGRQVHVVMPASPIPAMVPALPGNGVARSGVRVLGQGWLSVVVFPALTGLTALNGGTGKSAIVRVYSSTATVSSTSSSTAYSSTLMVTPPGAGPSGQSAAQIMALLRVLLNAAKPVHGAWGSGKLLQTTLLNALITSKGRVLIGAVTPAVLYADAAKVK